MAEVTDLIQGFTLGFYNWFLNLFPSYLSGAVQVLFFAVLLAVVSIFIWKFYNSLSKKNLISLNLRQYNRADHPAVSKILAIILYFLEYIIIVPFLILIWFAALSIVILLVSEGKDTGDILVVTAAIVGAIRILAYYNREISKDLAKLFPFVTLSVFLITAGAFNFDRVISQISEIPKFLGNTLYFLFAVFIIEIVLRVFYTIIYFWDTEEEIHPPKLKGN